jgi:hypothetical protein
LETCRPNSTPVIEHVTLIGDGDSGTEQLANRGHNAMRPKIALRIVVLANNQEPWIMSPHDHDEIVKDFEVLMVVGETSPVFTHRVNEVSGVAFSGHSRIAGKLDVVASLAEQPCGAAAPTKEKRCRRRGTSS